MSNTKAEQLVEQAGFDFSQDTLLGCAADTEVR